MQINFDINEFLAYLLNGGLLLTAILQLFDVNFEFLAITQGAQNYLMHKALNIITLLGMIFIAGHISSIFSRYVVRRIIWLFTTRPRERIFTKDKDSFWTNELKRRMKDVLQTKFKISTVEFDEGLVKKTAPRMIRAYILANIPKANDARNRVVRDRSLCANAVLPTLCFSLNYLLDNHYFQSILFFSTVIFMILKQHDLDIREWKDIYLQFIFHHQHNIK